MPGLIDYFSIDEAAMKRIANLHLALNLGAVVVFYDQSLAQIPSARGELFAPGNTIFGVLSIGAGGWLGGEMVYVKGMAVEAVEKAGRES